VLVLILNQIRGTRKGNEPIADESPAQIEALDLELDMKEDSSYCQIQKAFERDGEIYMVVDFIQYFTFDQAIEEARKRGQAEHEILENGDTNYFVFNDYFIANDNPRLRTYRLNEATRIESVPGLNGLDSLHLQNFPDEFEARGNPFFIWVENGWVSRMKEIFIP